MVLNYCREEATRRCLRSVLASDRPALRVLLVDNGSEDGSGERLRRAFPDVSYLQTGENLGYSGGNNAGFEWALERGTDYVLVLNNDTVVEEGALERLVRTAESGERVGGVCPTVVYDADPGRVWYGGGAFSRLKGLGVHWHEGAPLEAMLLGRENGKPVEEGPRPREVSFLTGCACLFPAGVIRRHGGFASDFFMYVEDAELSLRLRREGYALLHEPRARIRHEKPLEEGPPSPFRIRLRDRNRRRIMRRHFGPLGRLPFQAWFWPSRAVRLLQHLSRGDLDRARAIVEGALER